MLAPTVCQTPVHEQIMLKGLLRTWYEHSGRSWSPAFLLRQNNWAARAIYSCQSCTPQHPSTSMLVTGWSAWAHVAASEEHRKV